MIAPLLVGVYVVDRFLNRGDFFGFFVRNFSIEFLFQCHHQFNGVQRVGTQVSVKEELFWMSSSFNVQALCHYFFFTRSSIVLIYVLPVVSHLARL